MVSVADRARQLAESQGFNFLSIPAPVMALGWYI